MFDHCLTMRMDKSTNHLLEELIIEKNIPSRAEAVRRAIRLMHKLSQIEKNSGEIIISSSKTKEKKKLILC